MPVSLEKTPISKGVSLAKNPLFMMIDTETVYMKKRVYELGYIVFDSVTCAIVDKGRFLIKETLESALFYFLRHGKTPIFWPESRLNVMDCIKSKDCVNWSEAIGALLASVKKYDVAAFIAHNIAFDIGAIYKTSELYSEDFNSVFSVISPIEKLELSGYFIHGLPDNLAYDMPHKVKSGCMTMKADFLVPALVAGASQNHDALGDCINQLALYKIATENNGRYQNQGTIYANMQMFHAVQYESARRLGTSELD
jgi:hypothetical protein